MKNKVPGSGGRNAAQGTPKLNKWLQTPMPNVERASHTRDQACRTPHPDGWPSMWDMARSMTKQGKSK